MKDLFVGGLHVLRAQHGVLEFGSRNVVFADEGHHQDVFLEKDHLWTGDLRLLHPDHKHKKRTSERFHKTCFRPIRRSQSSAAGRGKPLNQGSSTFFSLFNFFDLSLFNTC